MMYVEFMKIFFSPIRASWWLLDSLWHPEPKNKWFLLCRHDVRRVHENFLLADSSELMAVKLILASWAQKTSDSYFVDMMYVEFMKNFLLADSSDLMAVRFILASWAQKQVILTL